jgi:hypothetical protein
MYIDKLVHTNEYEYVLRQTKNILVQTSMYTKKSKTINVHEVQI